MNGSIPNLRKNEETISSLKITSPRSSPFSPKSFSPRVKEAQRFFPPDRPVLRSQKSRDDERKESISQLSPSNEEEAPLSPEARLDCRRMSIAGLSRRRSSIMANLPSSSQQPQPPRSFKAIGGRVASLVRAKMAFQKTKLSSIDDQSEMTVIKELPKKPRFSSFMSPEAQFAMMKGYEDNVYGKISTSQPEVKPFLKRNKTPEQPIDIKDVKRPTITRQNSMIDVRKNPFTPLHSSTPRSTSGSEIPQRPYTARRARSLSRIQSLPTFVPRDKQLVLTYRLQSAMDMLDTLRSHDGENPLSPRIKSAHSEIKPLDFNKWTQAWSREFQLSTKS